MELYKEKFGDVEIYVEDKLQGLSKTTKSDSSGMLNTKTTSTKELDIKPSKIREMVKSVIASFGEDMQEVKSNTGVTSMELSLSLSMKSGFWVIESEGQLSLKLVWQNK